jgi:hypothetical protein
VTRGRTRARSPGSIPGRAAALIAAGAATVAAAVSVVLWRAGWAVGGGAWRDMLPVLRPAATVATVAAAVALALAVARRRWPGLRGYGSVCVLALALAAGLPTLVWDAQLNSSGKLYYHTRVDPDQAAGARWLRDHSAPMTSSRPTSTASARRRGGARTCRSG